MAIFGGFSALILFSTIAILTSKGAEVSLTRSMSYRKYKKPMQFLVNESLDMSRQGHPQSNVLYRHPVHINR